MINQSKLTLKILKSNVNIANRPYKLNFYLTDICNFRCKICNIWDKKIGNELDIDEISEFFKKNNYFSWIDITGGEIFLRRDIDEIFNIIIRECKDLHLLHFPTHGFFTEKVYNSVRKIKDKFNGRLVVTVSLDGPKELHNKIRGIESWENAVNTFKKVDSINKGNVFIGYTLSKHNVGKLDETFKELKSTIPDLSINKIHLNLAQISSHYYSNEENNLLGDMGAIIKEIDFLISNRKLKLTPFYYLEAKFLKLLRKFALEGKHPLKKCMALNSTITINPEGYAFPCLFFNKKLGSLRDVSFDLDKILFNDESMELKKDILKHCPHCWSACEAYPTILSNITKS